MRFIFLILVLIFCALGMNAQNNDFREDRKGQLFFKVGTEYRITPLPVSAGDLSRARFTNSDQQNSGVALHYDIDFFVAKNFSLGFANSFRYTLLNFSDRLFVDGPTGQDRADNALFVGFHFNVAYYFKVFKSSELFIRIGKSLLNRGSEFRLIEPINDANGDLLLTTVSQSNYNLSTNNFALGYKKDKLEIILGIYGTSDTPYFDRSVGYVIPYINLGYTLGKL